MSIEYVLLNMSHALMSVMGMLAHYFKKARKALHYKHARMKHHTTTVANITFLNSGISSLNKRKKKKTKANTVKLQNPTEAAPIVDHIKQSRLGKGAEGGLSEPDMAIQRLATTVQTKRPPKASCGIR